MDSRGHRMVLSFPTAPLGRRAQRPPVRLSPLAIPPKTTGMPGMPHVQRMGLAAIATRWLRLAGARRLNDFPLPVLF